MFLLRREIHKRHSFAALFAALALLAGSASGQTRSDSASALIKTLSKPRPKGQPIVVRFHCGMIIGPRRERQTAKELVQLGRTALPDLERAFDSIEGKGWESSLYENAGWLFFAYARILGPAAVPRLQRMATNPKLRNARRSLDDALALSLGLTSYVSGMGYPSPSLVCGRDLPRDALDKLVVSLEHGDLAKLQETLGPEARNALDQALHARSWETIRQEIWRPRPGVDHAVGYRFEIQGPWSEPEETLEQPVGYQNPPLAAGKFSLNTQFTDSAGKDCGRYKVDFVTVRDPRILDDYRIDNTDIEDLLRSIGRCAAE
jgi:hypothetical protein